MIRIYRNLLFVLFTIFVSINMSASQPNIYLSQINSEEEPQNKSPYLVLKYFGIPENKYELDFLSSGLKNYNFSNEADLEKAITEGHKYFIEHQDEILLNLKTNELLLSREIAKEERAAARAEIWGPLLSALPNIFAAATSTAIEVSQQQQIDNQTQINRDREIQAYLAQQSSSTPRQFSQNFGVTHETNTTNSRKKVTTSNGYDEPLTSVHVSKQSDVIDVPNGGERIIQGVFLYLSQKAVVRLRYNSGRIWAYSTSRDALNREQWIGIQPDSPRPTMELRDGDLSKDYKYTVSGDGKVFYFNM